MLYEVEGSFVMTEYRIVVVGAGAVGKSCLTLKYVQKVFVDVYNPTVEDSYRKQELVDDEPAMLDILDTAGQEEYSSVRDHYMKTGQGFICVYSITSRSTFDSVLKYRELIQRVKDADDVPMILVGNKSDLEAYREIERSEGEALARKYRVPFMETSAKDGRNVDAVFLELVRLIRKDPAVAQTLARKRALSLSHTNSQSFLSSKSATLKRRGCVIL